MAKIELTEREIMILKLTDDGCSQQQIASNIFHCVSMVIKDSAKIRAKLGVKRMTQAVEVARRGGFIE